MYFLHTTVDKEVLKEDMDECGKIPEACGGSSIYGCNNLKQVYYVKKKKNIYYHPTALTHICVTLFVKKNIFVIVCFSYI